MFNFGADRPLVASKVESPELGKVLRFPGHFPLDKFKLWKQGQLDLMVCELLLEWSFSWKHKMEQQNILAI